jgi:diacylglycerol kinase
MFKHALNNEYISTKNLENLDYLLIKEKSSIMKNKKMINSFKNAFNGMIVSFKQERNMKIHISIMFLVILLGIIFKIKTVEWIICIICFALVIGGELFNTVIEITVDIAMPNFNEKAKKAKDISAGAVLVLAIASAIIGFIIFVPKIIG